MVIYILVSGFNPSEKYESQLGWWHSQYMEKNHVPNHQPDNHWSLRMDSSKPEKKHGLVDRSEKMGRFKCVWANRRHWNQEHIELRHVQLKWFWNSSNYTKSHTYHNLPTFTAIYMTSWWSRSLNHSYPPRCSLFSHLASLDKEFIAKTKDGLCYLIDDYLVAHPTNRKWVITPVINRISRVNPLITGVITHLLSGMSHHV